MNIEEYRKLTKKGNKYGAKKTLVGDLMFDSKGEANRYQELTLLQKAGKIKNLERQVRIPCMINNIKVFTYVADFLYFDLEEEKNIIEDFKGMETDVFKLKKKVLEAQGIKIKISRKQKETNKKGIVFTQ